MEKTKRESSAMILQMSSQDQWYQHHLVVWWLFLLLWTYSDRRNWSEEGFAVNLKVFFIMLGKCEEAGHIISISKRQRTMNDYVDLTSSFFIQSRVHSRARCHLLYDVPSHLSYSNPPCLDSRSCQVNNISSHLGVNQECKWSTLFHIYCYRNSAGRSWIVFLASRHFLFLRVIHVRQAHTSYHLDPASFSLTGDSWPVLKVRTQCSYQF